MRERRGIIPVRCVEVRRAVRLASGRVVVGIVEVLHPVRAWAEVAAVQVGSLIPTMGLGGERRICRRSYFAREMARTGIRLKS